MSPDRFPLQPLADALGIELYPSDGNTPRTGHDHPQGTAGLAERLQLPRRTIQRWRAAGIPRHANVHGAHRDVPDYLARTYAHRHPAALWGDWLDDPDPDQHGPFLDEAAWPIAVALTRLLGNRCHPATAT